MTKGPTLLEQFAFVALCWLIAALGWTARGIYDAVEASLHEPVVTVEAPIPRDVATSVSRELPTLWHIAREYYPGYHTGQMVDLIRKANPDLDPGKLRIGQTVWLPSVEVE